MSVGQLQHSSVLCPTQAYLDALPGRQLPDTWDFFNAEYMQYPERRMAAWDLAFELSCKGITAHPADLISGSRRRAVSSSAGSCVSLSAGLSSGDVQDGSSQKAVKGDVNQAKQALVGKAESEARKGSLCGDMAVISRSVAGSSRSSSSSISESSRD